MLSSLLNNKKYMEFYDLYQKMYENNSDFREGCLATSLWVLAGKGVQISDDSAVKIAVKYFLAELPLYLNTPDILNISSSLFVYKDLPSNFLSSIYNGHSSFGSLLSLRQGCLAVKFCAEERSPQSC
jgi:cyclo(L-tyrosyl-L-tyrosyl) synthase